MSLINQMLLDLDRRHAIAGPLPAAARGVPSRPATRVSRRRAGTLLAAGTGVGLAALITFAWQPDRAGATVAPAVLTPAPLPTGLGARGPIRGLGLDPVDGPALPVVGLPTIVPMPAVPAVSATAVTAPVAAPASFGAPAATVDATPTTTPTATARTLAAVVAPPAVPVAIAERPVPATPYVEPRLEKIVPPQTLRERAEGDYQRALALHQQGRAGEAQDGFATALKLDPAHAGARQALAVSQIGEGRLDEAQRLLEAGLQLNPQDISLAGVLARVKADQQDLPGAIAVLKTALPAKVAPGGRVDDAEARALLATLQQRGSNHLGAIENYGVALRQSPGNGAWWIGLGLSLAAEGRADDARDAFEHARATRSLGPELDQYAEQRLRALTR